MGVSPVPGFTRVSQEVVLDKNIRLIDSPGIVFADGDSAAVALRNCVHIESLTDVLTPVQAILDRCPAPYLMQLYGIANFKDCMGFLTLVARASGRLKKGGVPNTDAAARAVLHDWNTGRIKYYCRPPARTTAGTDESRIVEGFSSELDVDGLAEVRVLEAIDTDELCDYVAMETVAGSFEGSEAEQAEDAVTTVSSRSRARKASAPAAVDEASDKVNLRGLQREGSKRLKKALRRQAARSDEPYDFETDFHDNDIDEE